MSPNHDGKFLAELPRFFHEYRETYLDWAEMYQRPMQETLANYRRAMIGWYEASIQMELPYEGEVYDYVTAIAAYYFNGGHAAAEPSVYQPQDDVAAPATHNPLNYLPRTVRLDESEQLMLRLFHEMGKQCREVLLLSDYHNLAAPRIGQALNIEGQLDEVRSRRSKCMLMARESWQAAGILDPVLVPSPTDELLIDRYYAGQLSMAEQWEVEARRPGDAVFRRAMELREDWAGVIVVAGRQDLMQTLEREEARYAVPAAAAPASPALKEEVKLSRRRDGLRVGKVRLPNLQSLLSLILFGAFIWLMIDTFGGGAPDRLYEAYFEPLPNLFDAREPRDANERDLAQILYYYDRKDYRNAYEELLPVAQAYPAAPLYLGVSALALDQPVRAQDWLKQILPGDPYYEYAQWYEALAVLGGGSRPAAAAILDEIVRQPGHPFYDRAQRLLSDL